MARQLRLINSRSNEAIFQQALLAESMAERFWGLMGKSKLAPDEALILPQCRMVHSLFMSFALDLVFCTESGVVIKLYPNLKPWRISPYVPGAFYTIEALAATINKKDLRLGDRLEFLGR